MLRDDRPAVLLIMGPTACGKTDLAVALVERLAASIVSVDSALIYRGMDIGTAKPDPATLARAPHRLIDIRDPAESYSAAAFRADAEREIDSIVAEGRLPILVGGTMLYFRALREGMSPLPSADESLRKAIEAEAGERGWPALHDDLAQVDPAAAARIHPNDPQRLQRALEVYRLTGRPLTELWRTQADRPARYRFIPLILAPTERSLLHDRIARRFEAMLERGFVAEVEALRARGDLHLGLPSMRCVGYRQVWNYLEGDYDRIEMVNRGVAATRQFAKRQFTWLRREEGSWVDPFDGKSLDKALKIVRDRPIH